MEVILLVFIAVCLSLLVLVKVPPSREKFSTNKLFVVIIASYDLPVYGNMIRLRRKQLEHYNVPHAFILDGPMPVDLAHDEFYHRADTGDIIAKRKSDHVPMQFANIIFKFHEFTKMFLSMEQYRDVTHVLRVNVSTFVNFHNFNKIFCDAPRERCHMGIEYGAHGGITYLSGLAVLYSRDVMRYFASLDIKSMQVSYDEYDDTAMGAYLNEVYPPVTNFLVNHGPTLAGSAEQDKATFIRVKARVPEQRLVEDTRIWKALLKRYDGLDGDDELVHE